MVTIFVTLRVILLIMLSAATVIAIGATTIIGCTIAYNAYYMDQYDVPKAIEAPPASEGSNNPSDTALVPVESVDSIEACVPLVSYDSIDTALVPVESVDFIEACVSLESNDPIETTFVPVKSIDFIEAHAPLEYIHSIGEGKPTEELVYVEFSSLTTVFVPMQTPESTEAYVPVKMFKSIKEFVPIGYLESIGMSMPMEIISFSESYVSYEMSPSNTLLLLTHVLSFIKVAKPVEAFTIPVEIVSSPVMSFKTVSESSIPTKATDDVDTSCVPCETLTYTTISLVHSLVGVSNVSFETFVDITTLFTRLFVVTIPLFNLITVMDFYKFIAVKVAYIVIVPIPASNRAIFKPPWN